MLRETVELTHLPELAFSFWKPLQLSQACDIPWSRHTWPLVDRRYTNQLLDLGCYVISTTVPVLTGHCVMGRHAERMILPLCDSCRECRSVEEEETDIHFLCHMFVFLSSSELPLRLNLFAAVELLPGFACRYCKELYIFRSINISFLN